MSKNLYIKCDVREGMFRDEAVATVAGRAFLVPRHKVRGGFGPDAELAVGKVRRGDDTLIVMDAEQTVATAEAAPRATVVATHMEALDHATVSRDVLRAHAAARKLPPERLLVPVDGELLTLPADR